MSSLIEEKDYSPDYDIVKNNDTDDVKMIKLLNKSLVEIFGRDVPEGTNLYSRDK